MLGVSWPHVASRPRIGVGYAGAWATRPYRVVIPGDPYASRRRARRPQPAGAGGAADTRAVLARARGGGRLAPAELLDVVGTLHATDLFRRRLTRWSAPQLAGGR